jgi:hypothetical protein
MMANHKNEKPRDDDYPDIVPEDTDLVIDAVAHQAGAL